MSGDECIQNLGTTGLFHLLLPHSPVLVALVDPAWRQFRFSVGAPDAEAKFKAAVEDVQKTDKNAKKFPSLYVCFSFLHEEWS